MTRIPTVARCRRTTWLIAVAAALLLQPATALSELRPLVREMIENLGAVNQIGEGLALEEYDQVQRAALDLRNRARRLKQLDLKTLGLDLPRDPQWDAFLSAQEKGANAILEAAKAEDDESTLLALRQLVQKACLSCHTDFRERNRLLRPGSLFMTTFLSAWKEINRGLALNDLALVARSARELQAMARVLSWDQVIESTFGLADPAERRVFRQLLMRMSAQAARIEQAAVEEDVATVLQADYNMWRESCLACHAQFR
jgi:cytochrome c556